MVHFVWSMLASYVHGLRCQKCWAAKKPSRSWADDKIYVTQPLAVMRTGKVNELGSKIASEATFE